MRPENIPGSRPIGDKALKEAVDSLKKRGFVEAPNLQDIRPGQYNVTVDPDMPYPPPEQKVYILRCLEHDED